MKRILLVEDEPIIATALQYDLELEGHEVTLVSDGLVASRRAREEPFDLIVLDAMLPGRDGFDVCRDVRNAGRTTPVLMLTARAQEAEKVLAFELGADDYVTKPFGTMELRARIKALLRRADIGTHAAARTEVTRFGNVELDEVRGEVRRDGERVDVTITEFRLLEAFVRNAGRVLTRQQLLDAVWGPGFVLSDRAVDNHIVNLRRKLETVPSEPRHIVSVRGLGYRLDT